MGFLKRKKDSSKEQTSTADTRDLSQPSEVKTEEKPKELSQGLQKSRGGFLRKITDIFKAKPKLDAEMLEELEALLIQSDVGVKVVQRFVAEVKDSLRRGDEVDYDDFIERLKAQISPIFENEDFADLEITKRDDGPTVIMVVGVNGAGKTTTIGKIAQKWKEQGKSLMLCAGDTFRAAAVEQLQMWGERTGVPVVSGAENAKPATVVYDAMQRALNDGVDCLIIDTAGRLHTKTNLMAELEGVRNAITRHQSSAPHEVILVVDGTTGQNALLQAQQFDQAVNLTGLVVTKLDGTAKGGIVISIAEQLKVPVRFIGVGEGVQDLRDFNAREYLDALFNTNDIYTLNKDSEDSANAQIRKRKRRAV
ncbi:MAG: signal recognition particle-docking protein FtsY [Deltaproteobacteria bacterium]|nr:signal recognition particle-docking protein FtsY [Deltaproteobacteria bacterium]